MLRWIDKGNDDRVSPQLASNANGLKHQYALVSGKREDSELEERIERLEKKLETIQVGLQQITKSNENTQGDMKFFEAMLLEEYHLLLQLLGKDQSIRIHQAD